MRRMHPTQVWGLSARSVNPQFFAGRIANARAIVTPKVHFQAMPFGRLRFLVICLGVSYQRAPYVL